MNPLVRGRKLPHQGNSFVQHRIRELEVRRVPRLPGRVKTKGMVRVSKSTWMGVDYDYESDLHLRNVEGDMKAQSMKLRARSEVL